MYERLINIHGVPRSGTTWLAEIFNSAPCVRYKHQPLYKAPFKGTIGASTSAGDLRQYFERLYHFAAPHVDRTEDRLVGIAPQFPIKDSEPTVLVSKHVRHHFLVPHLLEQLEEQISRWEAESLLAELESGDVRPVPTQAVAETTAIPTATPFPTDPPR